MKSTTLAEAVPGRRWTMARPDLPLTKGASSPTMLQFNDTRPIHVAVDTAGNFYDVDDGKFRVVQLPAQ
jgi:hypothetical protein